MDRTRRQLHEEVSALNDSFDIKLKLRNMIEARVNVEKRVSNLLKDVQSTADFARLRIIAVQQECVAQDVEETARTQAAKRLAARHVSFIKRQIRLLQRRTQEMLEH